VNSWCLYPIVYLSVPWSTVILYQQQSPALHRRLALCPSFTTSQNDFVSLLGGLVQATSSTSDISEQAAGLMVPTSAMQVFHPSTTVQFATLYNEIVARLCQAKQSFIERPWNSSATQHWCQASVRVDCWITSCPLACCCVRPWSNTFKSVLCLVVRDTRGSWLAHLPHSSTIASFLCHFSCPLYPCLSAICTQGTAYQTLAAMRELAATIPLTELLAAMNDLDDQLPAAYLALLSSTAFSPSM
jgi:hypothetical protein